MGVVWYESGERRSGWRVWLRRAAHHFLPEDPVLAAGDAGAPGDERRGGNGGSGGAEPSLDHVLRSAAAAGAVPERDEE